MLVSWGALRARPLFAAALNVCHWHTAPPHPIFFGVFLIAGFLGCWLLSRWMKYPPVFLCLVLALAGFLGMSQSLGNNVLPAEGVELVGVVQDMRYTRAGWQRLVVRNTDGLRILAFLSPDYPVQIGQRVILYGDMHSLQGPRNPGAYNEFTVLRAQGIAGRFNARSAEVFEIETNLARATYSIRNRIADVYDTVLPHRQAGLVQSIVLGERPDMDDRVVEMFRMAGIYHLLVVSGLHLSILMMAACLILERVMNKRAAGLSALVLMIGYTLLTGASVSTVRAVTMAGVAVFGRLLYRDRDPLSSVSFACILLLLYEPMNLFSIGFQLSFATVFGVVLLSGPIERALSLLGMKNGRAFLAYNIAANVSTYPILAYHFAYISTYSILVNILIAPTVVLLVVVGFAVGFIGLFSIGAAHFLAGAVYFILRFYEAVMAWFLALPDAVWLVGNWGIKVTFAALAFMLAFGYTFSGFGEDFRRRSKVLVLGFVILLTCVAFEAVDRRRFHITELDIDGGFGVTVLRAGGNTFVIDGGGNNRLIGMNTGVSVLMPYLDHRGVLQVCAAFLTDTSRGRVMGLIELAEAGRMRTLYVPYGVDLGSGLGMRLAVAADRGGVTVYRLGVGDVVRAGRLAVEVIATQPGLELHVLYGHD